MTERTVHAPTLLALISTVTVLAAVAAAGIIALAGGFA